MIVLELTPSQLENVWPQEPEHCVRRWWGRAVRRMPSPPRKSSCFGDVAHAVVARWLQADDLGRGPDLYPPGWLNGHDRFGNPTGTLTPREGDLVRTLVSAAVDSSVLLREPGRKVEVPFDYLIELGSDRQVRVHGFVDLVIDATDSCDVVDHKFVADRKYVPGPKRLARNAQLLAYALAQFRRRPELNEVTTRIVGFVKDPEKPLVLPRSARVSREAIGQFEAQLREVALGLLPLLEVGPEGWPSHSRTLPVATPPPSSPRACLQYGKCPYLELCSGSRTEEQHVEAVSRVKEIQQNSRRNGLTTTPKPGMFWGVKKEDTVGFADKLKARAAINAAAGGAPAQAPPAPSKVAPAAQAVRAESAAASAPFDGTPPWANPDCRACKGSGVASSGRVCQVCSATAKQRKVPGPELFAIESDGAGGLVWVPLDGSGPGGSSGAKKPMTAQVQPEQAAPEPEPEEGEDDSEEEEEEETEDEEPSEEEPTPEPEPAAPEPEPPAAEAPAEPKKRGRPKGSTNKPKPGPTQLVPATVTAQQLDSQAPPTLQLPKVTLTKGLTLFVNTAVYMVGGPGQVHRLDTAFDVVARQVAQVLGVESYWQANAFARRDTLAALAGQTAASLDGKVLAGAMDTPDMVAFVATLRPYCSLYVEGTGR